jgi:predicted Ser/Thr protein kinase
MSDLVSPMSLNPGSPAGEPVPFTREQFARDPGEVLSRGRWANAVLYLHRRDGAAWVVKDFRPSGFAVRNTIGRFLIWREMRALRRVAGIEGVPAGVLRLDAHALAYRFVPGVTLKHADLGEHAADFFVRLERVLMQVHAAGRIVHLDVRNARNVLVTERGEPLLLDFQSAISTRWMPERLRRLAERVDLGGVYKHWQRSAPDSLDEARAALLSKATRWRALWPVHGYFGRGKRAREARTAERELE